MLKNSSKTRFVPPILLPFKELWFLIVVTILEMLLHLILKFLRENLEWVKPYLLPSEDDPMWARFLKWLLRNALRVEGMSPEPTAP